MASSTVSPDQDAVVAEIEIAAPPDRVFAALTDGKQLMQWWVSPICETTRWEMDARPSGKWRFETSRASKEINGVREFKAHGEILEYVPGRMLVYSWIANWNDEPDVVTVVSWYLTKTSSGTHVKVVHSNLAKQEVARQDYRGGWPGVLGLLKNFAEK